MKDLSSTKAQFRCLGTGLTRGRSPGGRREGSSIYRSEHGKSVS